MTYTLAAIVEGVGDELALPGLIHRIRPEWRVARPIRASRPRLIKPTGPMNLEHYLPLARNNALQEGERGGILVLIDADDDCPAHLGQALSERIRRAVSDVPFVVVAANREYEAWLLAGLPEIELKGNVELVRDAKGRLKQHFGQYKSIDQKSLTARFDLTMARERSPSFRKFMRSIELLGA